MIRLTSTVGNRHCPLARHLHRAGGSSHQHATDCYSRDAAEWTFCTLSKATLWAKHNCAAGSTCETRIAIVVLRSQLASGRGWWRSGVGLTQMNVVRQGLCGLLDEEAGCETWMGS